MKIEFSRSGGFAGPAQKQRMEIDTDDLPASEAEELLKLVNDANLQSQASPATTSSRPAPDAFHYQIKVNDQGTSQVAKASDADMPESLSRLIDWLSNRATRRS